MGGGGRPKGALLAKLLPDASTLLGRDASSLGGRGFVIGRTGMNPGGASPIGEKAAQSLRHRNHLLLHGHRRDDVIDEIDRGLRHVRRVRVGRHARIIVRRHSSREDGAAVSPRLRMGLKEGPHFAGRVEGVRLRSNDRLGQRLRAACPSVAMVHDDDPVHPGAGIVGSPLRDAQPCVVAECTRLILSAMKPESSMPFASALSSPAARLVPALLFQVYGLPKNRSGFASSDGVPFGKTTTNPSRLAS